MRRKTFVSDIPDAWIPQRSGLPSPQSPSIPEAWIPRPPRGMPQHTDPRGAPRGGPVAFGGPTRPRGPRGFGGPGTNIQQVSSSTGIPDAWIPSKIPGFVQFQNQPFSIFRNPLAPKSPVANPVVNPVLTKDSTSTIVQNTPMTLSTLLETIEDLERAQREKGARKTGRRGEGVSIIIMTHEWRPRAKCSLLF